jgi:hypothetical protein
MYITYAYPSTGPAFTASSSSLIYTQFSRLPEAKIAVELIVHVPLGRLPQVRNARVLELKEVGSITREWVTVGVAIDVISKVVLEPGKEKLRKPGKTRNMRTKKAHTCRSHIRNQDPGRWRTQCLSTVYNQRLSCRWD